MGQVTLGGDKNLNKGCGGKGIWGQRISKIIEVVSTTPNKVT